MPTPIKKPLRPAQIAMIAGLLLIAAFIVSFGISMLQPYMQKLENQNITTSVAPTAYDESYGMAGGATASRDSSKLVMGNTGIIAPYPTTPPAGNNAESFDVTTYSANIETPNLKDTCAKILALKSRKDVIFQSSDENERACNYTFKATKTSAEEVLNLLKSMDPKTLNQNIYTIKQILENYASQVDILKQKEAAVQATLKDAVADYDELAKLARTTKDTDSLTKILNSKIDLITRLTNESINNNAQLEQLARAQAEQADQLVYTNFNVSIIENTYLNGRDLKDSWDNAVKASVAQLNAIAQGLSLGLVLLLLITVQYCIYGVILLFVAKYGWRFVKSTWNKK